VILCGIGAEPFGPRGSLVLEHLDRPLLVLYGGNAAGKSALVELLADILCPQHTGQSRWLAFPAEEGLYRPKPPEGRAWVQWRLQQREFRLLRHFGPGGDPAAQAAELQWLAPVEPKPEDVQPWLELRAALAELSPDALRHTFFLQEEHLRRIHAPGAAAWEAMLYQVGTGLRREQLARVQKHLRRLLGRLCSPDEENLLARLLRRRRELVEQLEQAAGRSSRFDLLHRRIQDLAEQIDTLQRDHDRLSLQHRACQVAQEVLPLWQQQQGLLAQLEHLPAASGITPPQVRRTAHALKQLRRLKKRLAALRKRRSDLRDQLRRCPRVASPNVSWPQLLLVLQQQELLHTLEDQLRQARRRMLRWQQRYEQAQARQAPAPSGDSTPRLPAEQIDQLRQAQQELEHQRQRVQRMEDEYEKLLQRQQELQSAATSPEEQENPKQLQQQQREKLKRRAEALRRRVQLSHRIQEAQQHLEFLEEQLDQLLEAQVLPRWQEVGFGVGFALGGALLLAGLLLPSSWTGGMGLLLFLLGAAGVGGAWGGKRFLQKKLLERLQQCQQELDDTHNELEQLRQEEKQLPPELDPSQGPWELQLQKVKDQLALLEPQVSSSGHSSEDPQRLQRRLEKLQQQLQNHTHRLEQLQHHWEQLCRQRGLSPEVDPEQLQPAEPSAPQPVENAQAIKQHLEEAQAAYQRARSRFQAWEQQVQRLAQGLGLSLSSGELGQQLAELQQQLHQHQRAQAQRKSLRRRLHRVQRSLARGRARARRYRAWCDRMLVRLDLESLGQLHKLIRQALKRLEVLEQVERLDAQMAAPCGDVPLEVVKELLQHETPARIQQQAQTLTEQLNQLKQQLEQLHAQQQQLHQQRQQLAQDQRPGQLQAELTALEYQLQQLALRWASGALAYRSLRRACAVLELEDASSLLRQAESFLRQLTCSRFVRLGAWSDRPGLWLQDEHGCRYCPGQLSRATQDQLYLALRLAVAAHLRQQGIHLPLVLDEVFLRYDTRHLQAAARLLKSLSSQGWQVIVLTAQPQVVQAFGQQGAELVSLDGSPVPAGRIAAEADVARGEVASAAESHWLEQTNRLLQEQAEALAEEETAEEEPQEEEEPAPAAEGQHHPSSSPDQQTQPPPVPEPKSAAPPEPPGYWTGASAASAQEEAELVQSQPPAEEEAANPEEANGFTARQRNWEAEEFAGELRDEVYFPAKEQEERE